MSFMVRLLCEDSRRQGEFAFEKLLIQMLCDRLECQPWDPRIKGRIHTVPLNGAPNVMKECDADRMFRDGIPVVALYDEDQLCTLFDLDHRWCRRRLYQAVVQRSKHPGQLAVVLLRFKMETVLAAICEHTSIDPEIEAQAIAHKRLNARDIILARAAAPSPAGKALRSAVLATPAPGQSLAYLLDKLVTRLPR